MNDFSKLTEKEKQRIIVQYAKDRKIELNVSDTCELCGTKKKHWNMDELKRVCESDTVSLTTQALAYLYQYTYNCDCPSLKLYQLEHAKKPVRVRR